MSVLQKNSLGYTLMLLVGLFVACEPAELPDPIDNGPVYFSEMSLDGSSRYWGSGKDGIYNFTFLEKVRENAVRFSSILQQDTCTYPCPSSFRVDLYSRNPIQGSGIDPSIDFSIGPRNWEDLNAKVTTWLFKASLINYPGAAAGANNKWYLNQQLIGEDVAVVEQRLIDTSGRIEICSRIEMPRGRSQMICHKVVERVSIPMLAELSGVADSMSTMRYKARVQFGNPPYRYFWNGVEGDQIHEVLAIRDTMQIQLRVLDKAGNELIITNLADMSVPNLFGVNAQMKLEFDRQLIENPPFGRASLKWVDAEGVEYVSGRGVQDQSAYFRIVDSEVVNIPGQTGRLARLKLEFAGKLYGPNARAKYIDNGKATMLFRYEE